MTELTHLDAHGDPHMVDVSQKAVTARSATAIGSVLLPEVCRAVLAQGGDTRKGNVLHVARLAAIMGAKRTSDLIPLCHQVPLDGVDVDVRLAGDRVEITATARCHGRTGVEMEALTAVSVAALTVYDMLKAVSHDLVIGPIQLISKDGGRSGAVRREIP
jgi:cyclic pyranopterin phosphate synthase